MDEKEISLKLFKIIGERLQTFTIDDLVQIFSNVTQIEMSNISKAEFKTIKKIVEKIS